MSRTIPTTDGELQRAVEDELQWDPAVVPGSIGVSAQDHTVTLSSRVPHYRNRLTAVRAAERIKGVHAVTDQIVVEPAGRAGRTDGDLAEYMERALTWNADVPASVLAAVRNGVVTLEGTVNWNFQRRAAAGVVEDMSGVVDVVNNITLETVVSSHDVHDRIASALQRAADVDANTIHITSQVGHVNLTGSVSSLAERERALQAVWSAPGITKVSDELVIR